MLLFNLASSILDLSSMLVIPKPCVHTKSDPHWGWFGSGTGTGVVVGQMTVYGAYTCSFDCE